MKRKSSRLLARRARSVLAALGIVALGVGFTACGDDEQDQADEAVENLESALDEVDTEELQEQAEEAQKELEEAVSDIDTEALQQQAEEAQKKLEEATGGGN